MTLDTERVVFLRYTRDRAGRRGSGLRVGGTLVLTADHCARGSDHAVIVAGRKYGATVAWSTDRDDVDIAVLNANGLPPVEPLAYARINTATGALIEGCVALGFPAWNGDVRAQLNGYVPTGEGGHAFAKDGAPEMPAFKITTPAIQEKPVDAGDQKKDAGDQEEEEEDAGGQKKKTSDWAGISGSVIVTRDDQILGVVSNHAPAAGVGSLIFTPLASVDALAAEKAAEFWQLLGVEDPHALPVLPMPERMPRVLQLRSLAELDPINDLGVHPAVGAGTSGRLPDLPQYVSRDHDVRLRQVAGEAAGGDSRLVVVVGGSSTGKTRACQEMLALLPEWRVWRPINPTPSEAVLTGLPQVGPRTVVWLNEAQQYLDTSDDTGERVAAGLWELLRDERYRPVLVVATLWPEHWVKLTARDEPDRHAQARTLLSGHNIDVPEAFSPTELSMLAQQADADPRLAEAADRAADGQITQYLAGGPFLLDRYKIAPPAARALIDAAMDARRLGCGPHLPLALLEGAAAGYLTDTQWNQLDDNWLKKALAYATQLCNGTPGPLTRIRPRPDDTRGAAGTGHDTPLSYRLADYLDQYGRRQRHAEIPPSSFWTAAAYAQPADLTTLAKGAGNRGQYRTQAQLLKNAATNGDLRASADLIAIMDGLHPGDHRPAQWAIDVVADLTDTSGITSLLRSLLEVGAQDQVTALLARDPASHVSVHDGDIMILLGCLREAGAQDQVNTLAGRAAAQFTLDNPMNVAMVLRSLLEAGAQEQVNALLARDPAAHVSLDDADDVSYLLVWLRHADAQNQVTALSDRAATHVTLEDPSVVADLLDGLREVGAQDQVNALLARDPAAHVTIDNPGRVAHLLGSLREVGAQDQVNALLARDPAAHVELGNPHGVDALLSSLFKIGAQDQLAALERRAPDPARWLDRLREAPDKVSALGKLVTDAALDDPSHVAILLRQLLEGGTQDQISALLARDPATHVKLESSSGVAGLLDLLQEVGARQQIDALLLRDPAGHVALDGSPFFGVSNLLACLREVGGHDQVTALADRAAKQFPIDDPSYVASLLDGLREAGAQEQVTALLARDPATHVGLESLSGLAKLLDSLGEVDASDQITTLADRAAEQLRFPTGRRFRFLFNRNYRPEAITDLVDSLRRAGAQKQATMLVNRLPAEGLYEVFSSQGNNESLYRFGRNRDGSPAQQWGWDDLA